MIHALQAFIVEEMRASSFSSSAPMFRSKIETTYLKRESRDVQFLDRLVYAPALDREHRHREFEVSQFLLLQ